MKEYIAYPHESLYKLQEKISSLALKVKTINHALTVNSKTLELALDGLPFLDNQITSLETKILSMQQTGESLSAQLETQRQQVIQSLQNLQQLQQKISENEKENALLKVEQKKVQYAAGYFSDLLHYKGDIELIKLARADDYVGQGISYVEHEAHPNLEDQKYSIETALNQNQIQSSKLLELQSKQYSDAFSSAEAIESTLSTLETHLKSLDRDLLDLSAPIIKLKLLYDLSRQPTIHGAAIRNDIEGVLNCLATGSSANEEIDGKKPIIFACELGHLQLAIKLIDYTKLSENECKNLLNLFPKTDAKKYARLVSAFSNQNTYDHLWDNQSSVGDNLQKIFEDYYSPSVFKPLSLPDQVKRTLALSWDRKYLKEAENLSKCFSTILSDLKKDSDFCLKLIESNLTEYKDTTSNQQDDAFLKRLEYARNKCHTSTNKKDLAQTIAKIGIYADSKQKLPTGAPAFVPKTLKV